MIQVIKNDIDPYSYLTNSRKNSPEGLLTVLFINISHLDINISKVSNSNDIGFT